MNVRKDNIISLCFESTLEFSLIRNDKIPPTCITLNCLAMVKYNPLISKLIEKELYSAITLRTLGS